MIRLAVTDSATARELVAAGELVVDYLEVHGPHVDSARAQLPSHPMLLHNSLYNWSLAHPEALNHQRGRELTLERIAQTQTPWFSAHCGFSAAEVTFGDQAMQAISAPLPPDELMQVMCANIRQLQALIDIPLLLENLDYCPTNAYETICEPSFISAVLEETDTWFLLDLAHAQVSAAAFGMSISDYLAQLPLHRVRQLHISSPRWHSGKLLDAHEVLQAQDYALLEDVLTRTSPWTVTLEYTADAEALVEQVQQLAAVLRS